MTMSVLDSKIPEGPLAEKWTKYKNEIELVSPANKRNIDIIVVGTGLAGASAAASLYSRLSSKGPLHCRSRGDQCC